MTNPDRNFVTIPVRVDLTGAAADLRAFAGAFASAADMIDGDDPDDPDRITVDRDAFVALDGVLQDHEQCGEQGCGCVNSVPTYARRLIDSADRPETA